MKKPIEVDECRERFIVALDEITYCAECLAVRMGVASEYEDAQDCLQGLISRLEDVLGDAELAFGDAVQE